MTGQSLLVYMMSMFLQVAWLLSGMITKHREKTLDMLRELLALPWEVVGPESVTQTLQATVNKLQLDLSGKAIFWDESVRMSSRGCMELLLHGQMFCVMLPLTHIAGAHEIKRDSETRSSSWKAWWLAECGVHGWACHEPESHWRNPPRRVWISLLCRCIARPASHTGFFLQQPWK